MFKKISKDQHQIEVDNDFSFLGKKNEQIDDFFIGEAQLSCDVYQTADNIIVKAAMAGVNPDNLDISVTNDLLTIRGFREMEEEISEGDFYFKECYWGSFSRSIILPQEIDAKKIDADLKNGILTIKMPKKHKTSSIRIRHLQN